MLPKTYVLDIPQMPWRTEAMRARLAEAGVTAESFHGVHGMTVGVSPLFDHFDSPGHKITPGRMAIAMSKLLLWQRAIDAGHPEVLLIENDVTFALEFRLAFAASYAALPADWQVVHVGHCCGADKPTRRVNNRVSEIRHPLCCHAVLWKRDALRIAYAALLRSSWGTHSDCTLAETVYPMLRHYSFTPPLINPDRSFSEATAFGRWDTIPGWFDFGNIYDEQLNGARGGETFVEVGSWLGRSTAYMAEQIKVRCKRVTFYAVDTWKGSANEPDMVPTITEHGGDLYPQFIRNMSRAGVYDYVQPLRLPSVEAAGRFADGALDFVFIDGDHSTEAVAADIRAWSPKVRPGGCLAGHDIDRPSVLAAVRGSGVRWRQFERVWLMDGGT